MNLPLSKRFAWALALAAARERVTHRERPGLRLQILVTVAVGLVSVFGASGVAQAKQSSATQALRAWGHTSRTLLVRQPSGRVVEGRLAALRPAVDRDAQRLREL